MNSISANVQNLLTHRHHDKCCCSMGLLEVFGSALRCVKDGYIQDKVPYSQQQKHQRNEK